MHSLIPEIPLNEKKTCLFFIDLIKTRWIGKEKYLFYKFSFNFFYYLNICNMNFYLNWRLIPLFCLNWRLIFGLSLSHISRFLSLLFVWTQLKLQILDSLRQIGKFHLGELLRQVHTFELVNDCRRSCW